MNLDLSGKYVLITGASGGIGQATAQSFKAEGALTLLHYHRRPDTVESLQPELSVQADLRDERSADAMFDEILAAVPRIDAVVVNAGVACADDVPVVDMTLSQWLETINANLTSAFFTCRGFLRHLRFQPREAASIVLVGSTAGVFGEADHADYAASKAAMIHGLTLSLKNEIVRLAPKGRVNCVCPGWTDTPMAQSLMSDAAKVQRATSTAALRRIATPQDIANAIVFLSSERCAGHMTGAILPVTGGMEGRLLHP